MRATVEQSALPANSRKTTFRVKATDKAAGAGIRVGGLSVIIAVLGLILFIGWQVVPLFADAEVGEASPPVPVARPDVLLLHTDEYRRVGVCIERSGQVTTFSVSNGQLISRFRPAEIGQAGLTSAYLSLRTRTKRKVGAVADVPYYHLLLATSDGKVFVGHIAYVTDFLRFELDDEPAELAALNRPEEDEYKAVDYVPEVAIRDGKLVEHVPTFGLYRTIEPRIAIERQLDVETGGRAVKLVSGQISSGNETEARTTTTIVVTDDGKTRLVYEDVTFNRIKKVQKAEADTVDLTETLAGAPDFALVNELQDEIILAQASGDVHHFARKREGKFTLMYPKFSIFQPQFDRHDGKTWRVLIDEQRDDYGHAPTNDELSLTAVSYLLGDSTIVFGDSRGGLQCWFGVIGDGEGESRLERIRTLPPSAAPVVSIQASPISKAALVLDAQGNIRAINNTAERVYVDVQLEGASHAIFNRKGDGILAITAQGELHHWWVNAPHAEVSWNSLFGTVWYEDYPEPKYEWQSAGGTDDVEPKLSLVPLMKGTIKGAIYALIFAIPLGVLAAIYTSEFMHRNMRSILKPTMEVMASLPSVVLGFLAALYFAPMAASMMPTLVIALAMVPAVFMLFGWLWQRCPPSFVGKFGYWSSTLLLFALLGLGIWLSTIVGPRAEVFLFPATEGADPALLNPETFEPITQQSRDELAAGDFRTWTGGGQPLPRETEVGGRVLPKGWWIPGGHNLLLAILTVPLALLAGLGFRKLASLLPKRDGLNLIQTYRKKLEGKASVSMRAVAIDALFSLGLAALLLAIGYVAAMAVAPVLEWAFFSYDHPSAGRVADFRRAVTGQDGWKFEQTNSLVVGFAMGFAVIPIIYTIAEDALTSVPNQLRAASLACGASRWQTTTRVVLPAAASGIFSGIVIGLGRALGETMIVVMAAGGTPVMELQPLNGFRSLSAAIAIEMPEAPHGGTLYRTLFMGGLLLFCMAFVINTIAEVVRMRLRRRLSRL
jgi:phosphate transport system permease protein